MMKPTHKSIPRPILCRPSKDNDRVLFAIAFILLLFIMLVDDVVYMDPCTSVTQCMKSWGC